MSRIEHPYQEIPKVLAGYNTPVHKNDEKLLMKLHHLPGQQLEDVLSEFYVLIRSRIETFLRAEYSFKKVMAHIENKKTGEIVFSSEVEFPEFWSMQSITVFASKYLIRNVETSIVSAISRVVAWVAINGYRDGHLAFNSEDLSECNAVSLSAFDYGKFSIDDFAYALSEIIIEQRGTFNSPVWFNVGNSENPMTDCHQVSACFVTSVKDNMGSIIAQNVVNQMIALGGSGSGCDMTPIRSRKEWIGKQQGRPSGPIGFTGMFDAVLQATRSAGRFRRAAGLVSLKQHHPDIIEYIRFKANEEKKGRTLSTSMSEWDHEFASESQFSIFGTLRVQNINTAVRLTREFWDCYKDVDSEYPIRDRNGDKIGTLGCEELLYEIARAQLECGDPGIQYDDNINAWNPFLAMGLRFNSSNACSEVQYLDNSACNLASLRITAYYDSQKNTFNSINLYEDISIMLMAQDILIDFSYYPTEDIAKTSYNTRNLGLNYGDLGGLLYMMGLPYDSDEARCVAAVITSYFTACAHTASMDMALTLGSFKYLEEDIGDLKHHMKSILSNHYSMHGCLFDKPQNIDLVNSCDNTSFNAYKAITNIIMDNKNIPSFIRDMQTSSVNKYEYILNSDEADFKLRNATVTVFVPQGTVGLTLGNLTSGIEPFLSHSFGKDLVGGGNMRFITGDDIHHIARVNCNRIYGDSYEMINRLNETAIGTNGKNILSPMAHIMMMAAVQPLIGLGISKCITGDSVITTENGLRRINSFYSGEDPDSFSEFNIKVMAGRKMSNADQFYYGGKKKTWTVTLEDGRILSGTDRDKVLCANEDGFIWKRLIDLREDEFVCVKFGSECWGSGDVPIVEISELHGSGTKHDFIIPNSPSYDLGLFLGMLTADGHVTKTNYVVGLTKNDDNVLAVFGNLVKKLFNIDMHRIVDSRNGVTGITVGCKPLTEWLNGIGFSKKNIPDFILCGTREMALGYLSGLYLDGWVTARNSGKKQINEVAISQRYFSILRDVQALWDNLGIRTYFGDNFVNGKNYPVLRIKTYFIPAAISLLKFYEEHKINNSKILFNREYDDTRRWPFVSDVLKGRLISQSKINGYPYRATVIKKANEKNYIIGDCRLSYDYLKVVSVKYNGIVDVFDLSVPETNRFLANSIVNHNTVNCPSDTTVNQIVQLYKDAHKYGLKAVTIYVDGSKVLQPLRTEKKIVSDNVNRNESGNNIVGVTGGLGSLCDPRDVDLKGWAVQIGGEKFYVKFGWHPDVHDMLWEVWAEQSFCGGTVDGMAKTLAVMASRRFQEGIRNGNYEDVKSEIIKTWARMTFPPNGLVTWPKGQPEYFNGINTAQSFPNLLAQMVASLGSYPCSSLQDSKMIIKMETTHGDNKYSEIIGAGTKIPLCRECGREMIKSGGSSKCFTCRCGATVGGCG